MMSELTSNRSLKLDIKQLKLRAYTLTVLILESFFIVLKVITLCYLITAKMIFGYDCVNLRLQTKFL